MLNIMQKIRNKNNEEEVIEEKYMTVDEAASFVQEQFAKEEDDERNEIFNMASAGDIRCAENCRSYIYDMLVSQKVVVEGFTLDVAADYIYKQKWGLGDLEDIYRRPDVNEIRVLDDGSVYINREGKNEKIDIQLKTEDIETFINRMIIYDYGVSLDESNPRLESVRADGSRLTALCNPITKGHCFALRKHHTVDMSVENLKRLGTLNEWLWKMLSLLVKGRRNILISGGVDTGKTSLLRKLIGELDSRLAIRILDTDREIRAKEVYPDRDILEIEAHPEVGAGLEEIFQTILRLSPDVIIQGEFRGYGDAMQSINACIRGHDGSMATAHFTTPYDVVRGTAMLMLEEGLNLDLESAQARVARAYDVIVQMFGDSVRGTKKIVSVTEILESGNDVIYNEIVRWQPESEDYLGEGDWIYVNTPSSEMIDGMIEYGVSKDKIKEVFNC